MAKGSYSIPLDYQAPQSQIRKKTIVGSVMGWASLVCWLGVIGISVADYSTVNNTIDFAIYYGLAVGTGIHGFRFGSDRSRIASGLVLSLAVLYGIAIVMHNWQYRTAIIFYWTGWKFGL